MAPAAGCETLIPDYHSRQRLRSARYGRYARLLLLLISCTAPLVAQVRIYEQMYITALTDGEISPDEEALLKSLKNSLALTEDQVLEIERKHASTGEIVTPIGFSQAGRRKVIVQSMGYGNGLYGWGIPFVLGSESPQIYAGMQMLAFAGGFYYSWRYTKEMDLPHARATFLTNGSMLGILSFYPLVSLVGFKNWDSIDPEAKIMTTYMMVAVPIGYLAGDRLYRHWQPSDGQATLVTGAGTLGATHALIAQILATDIDADLTENWFRLNGLAVTAGYLGGGWMTWKIFQDQSVSTGDAYFMGLGAMLGYLNGVWLLPLLDPGFKPSLIIVTAAVDGGIYAAYLLGKNYDLTTGETAIVGLGSMAGWAALRGLALIIDMDQGSDALLAGDILARSAGAYWTFQRLKPGARETASRHTKTSFSVNPVMLGMGRRQTIGMNFGLRF